MGLKKLLSLVRDDCEHTLRESFPDAIPCPGLSPERQQYLFEKIREFCPEEVQILASVVHIYCSVYLQVQDAVCPKPTFLHTVETNDDEDNENDEELPPPKRRK